MTIGGETIPVKPVIGDLDEGEAFVVGEGSVMVTVRAIPALRYALLRGGNVESVATPAAREASCTIVAQETATAATVTLTDTEPPEGAAFYKVVVSVP